MLVRDRPIVSAEPLPGESREAGVIDDARSRQMRHRRTGAALFLAIALGALIYLNAGGGGRSGGDRPPVSHAGAPFIQTSTLRLARGRTTSTFLVKGIAGHAFDARFDAPATAVGAILDRDPQRHKPLADLVGHGEILVLAQTVAELDQ